jgi:hypothetical protein
MSQEEVMAIIALSMFSVVLLLIWVLATRNAF